MISLDQAACIAYSATFNGEQDVYFIRVEHAPLVLNIAKQDTFLSLSWKAAPGKTYCLQY